MRKGSIDRQQQTFMQHSFDDIFRRTYHIKILMPFFDFGEHDFVYIESLINDTYIFSCLFFIVLLKIFQHALTNIVCPVIYFQYILA